MFKKERSLSLSKFYSVQNEEYEHIQVIPSKVCKNKDTEMILILANTMYRKLDKLIKLENKKLLISSKLKLSYYIHITKDNTEFYFIVPKIYYAQLRTKLIETWKNVEVNRVDGLPIDINSCTRYELQYKLNDALSLKTHKVNDSLLDANLSILELLKTEESVGILYNFMPMSVKEQSYFKKNAINSLDEFKKGLNLKKSKNIIDLGVITAKFLLDMVNNLMDLLFNSLDTQQVTTIKTLDDTKKVSKSTDAKIQDEIIKTQIVIMAKSNDKDREDQLCNTLYNTYSTLNDDNSLEMKPIIKDLEVYENDIGVKYNYTSVKEAGRFVNIANKKIIDKHDESIKHNKVLELKAPKCLSKGSIRIGEVKVKNEKDMAYYSSDEQMKRMGRVLIGPMGSGKDTYMINLAEDIIKDGRGLIVIDYIDKCQLANRIQEITPKEKLIEINCANPKQLQTLSYDEYSYKESDDMFTKVDVCMQKAQQYDMLLDTINDVASNLSPRMLRYLNAAATISFMVNPHASFKSIMDALRKPDKREEIISKLPSDSLFLLQDEIDDLRDLDKTDTKGKVIGNQDSKIDGILDRVSKLKSSSIYTKLSFINSSENNINFIDAINDGKVILIKIPARNFSRSMRSLLATFFLQKIWIAKEQGATGTQTELFINEIHQSYHCQLLMEDILVECRKFNLTPTLAMHYLNQGTKKLKESILASGSSFLLMSGCDAEAFNELKRYFEKDGYTETDLTELDRYHALCLVKTDKKAYSSFVAHLPGDFNDTDEEVA